MSLSHETMLELMQYADGELHGEARARVEGLIETNDEARGVVEAMGMLGDVVRDGVDDRIGAADLDGLTESVMAAIALGVAASAKDVRVPATRGAPVVPLARRAGPAHRRFGAVSAVVGVLALAAAVVLFVRFQGQAERSTEPRFASAAPSEEAAPENGALRKGAEALGVDLEEVRSVENKVDVFFVPPAKSAGASVVVWIDDRHGEP